MVVVVVIIVPHSSIPYWPKASKAATYVMVGEGELLEDLAASHVEKSDGPSYRSRHKKGLDAEGIGVLDIFLGGRFRV